jgi:hypothetical protein
MDRSPLSAAIAAAKPGSGATRFAPALKVAGGILAESTLPRREVVLISDFQRGGWRGEDEGIRLPQGTIVTPITIGGSEDQVNVGVTAVSLARSTFSDQERVTVTAGLTNHSERPASGGTLTLAVNGIKHGTKPVQIEPGGTAPIEFEPVLVGRGSMKATVTLSADALAADNVFNFVVSPTQPVRVLVIDRGSESSLYLSRALAVGEAPRFDVTRAPENPSDTELQRSAAVVLNDVVVSQSLGRRLLAYVKQGGGLFMAAGPRANWPGDVDLLPGTISADTADRTRGNAARVGALEYAHPVFEPFRAPRSGNFASVPVYQYRKVTPAEGAQVLAKFDGTAPAVLERTVGAGRVLLWASTLDTSWSELPTRGVFLPFIHQSMRYLSAYSEPRPWLTVGQVLDASTAALKQDTAQRVVLTPSGTRVPLQDEGSDVMELTESGFYELRARDKDVIVVAANVDPEEGNLDTVDPKLIAAAATNGTGGDPDSSKTSEIPLTPEAQERSQRLWWYLLVGGLLLLGTDTLMSNRLAKT